jgi:hypothetical protein
VFFIFLFWALWFQNLWNEEEPKPQKKQTNKQTLKEERRRRRRRKLQSCELNSPTQTRTPQNKTEEQNEEKISKVPTGMQAHQHQQQRNYEPQLVPLALVWQQQRQQKKLEDRRTNSNNTL